MNIRSAGPAIIAFLVCWYFAVQFLSTVGVRLQHSDFYPLWNGTRAVLHGSNPYGQDVTLANQAAAYGTTAQSIGEKNEQRFAYPLYATFPIVPLALLDFGLANRLMFALIAVLLVASVGWIRGRWDGTTALYAVFLLASYSVVFALQIRQPTLLFLVFAIGSMALLRSKHWISAGVLAALSTSKPQVACAFLLPMLIWTLADWRERKRFVIWFAIAIATLLGMAQGLDRHWIADWIDALRAYARYHQLTTIPFALGSRIGLILSGVLLLGFIAMLWRRRHSSLLFQVSASVAVMYLLLPEEVYSAPILVVPAIWVADNAAWFKNSGSANQLALAAVRLALAQLWLANLVGAVLLHTNVQGKAVAFWFPVNAVFPVFVSLLFIMTLQLFHAGAVPQTNELLASARPPGERMATTAG